MNGLNTSTEDLRVAATTNTCMTSGSACTVAKSNKWEKEKVITLGSEECKLLSWAVSPTTFSMFSRSRLGLKKPSAFMRPIAPRVKLPNS